MVHGIVAGRLAFVTGAGSGIGRAACQILAREGATVISADKNYNAAVETIKTHTALACGNNDVGDHSAIELDVSDSKSVQDALSATLQQYRSPPSIVVNSAGITRDNWLLKLSEEDYDAVLNVNLKVKRIIVEAKLVLTQAAAKELAKFNIRVNCILPGFVNTPIVSTIPDKVKDMILKQIPLGRMGEPTEIAETITFLASTKSSYMTGTAIDVSGGY